MLSKCANPDCSTPFLYLHQGKLFRIEVDAKRDRVKLGPVGSEKKPVRRMEYFWLCDSCSSHLTVAYEQDVGVATVPLLSYRAAS
ncbi:MAG: hypothetical protein DMG70_18825 [Acidobacteria bacterium]|nr:MAG: hypothetical protein DMG70_18825 [Acidobacteriota bacterium]PYY11562.1 MAG: hypothetical protein DMG69_03680 [Acidobacteriota bacterium]